VAEYTFHPAQRALESPAPEKNIGGVETNQNDDIARFNAAVMPYLDDAYGLACWITGNSDDAEDVVQDSFLRAFRAIGDLYGDNARAWVLTIVRRAAYQWLRKNRSVALVFVDDLESVTCLGRVVSRRSKRRRRR
jgi:RNA polymerase sigma factor (sigma-70 family)